MALTFPERTSCAYEDVPMDQPMPQPVPVEEAFESLSAAAPEGWRVELIEGEIHVAPPANGEHEEIVTEVVHQVAKGHPNASLRVYTGLGLAVPDASVTGKVIPDLVIAPKGSFQDGEHYHDPSAVLLVGEVTSYSTAENDHTRKLRGYARAGIPLYLLIDRKARQATVFAQPSEDRYTWQQTVSVEQKLSLPEPLAFDLDTSEF